MPLIPQNVVLLHALITQQVLGYDGSYDSESVPTATTIPPAL